MSATPTVLAKSSSSAGSTFSATWLARIAERALLAAQLLRRRLGENSSSTVLLSPAFMPTNASPSPAIDVARPGLDVRVARERRQRLAVDRHVDVDGDDVAGLRRAIDRLELGVRLAHRLDGLADLFVARRRRLDLGAVRGVVAERHIGPNGDRRGPLHRLPGLELRRGRRADRPAATAPRARRSRGRSAPRDPRPLPPRGAPRRTRARTSRAAPCPGGTPGSSLSGCGARKRGRPDASVGPRRPRPRARLSIPRRGECCGGTSVRWARRW